MTDPDPDRGRAPNGPHRRPTPDPGVDPGVDEVVSAVLAASRLLVALSARSLATVEDTLTLPQFRMLVVLDGPAELSLSRLADHLAVNPSTALRMVERLVALGMVARRDSEVDRRAVRVTLTAAGRRTVSEVTGRRRAEIARVVAQLPTAQRAGLVDALRAFTTAGGEPNPPHTW